MKFSEIKAEGGNNNVEMCDIIPLVTHAWSHNFGKASNAKNAITQRGWGPLNIILLDHPDVRKATQESNAGGRICQQIPLPSSISTDSNNFDVGSVNVAKWFARDLINKILHEQLKDKNRIETLKEKYEKWAS
jgi:hypothetical protein